MKCDTPETGNKFLNIFHVVIACLGSHMALTIWFDCRLALRRVECTQLLHDATVLVGNQIWIPFSLTAPNAPECNARVCVCVRGMIRWPSEFA